MNRRLHLIESNLKRTAARWRWLRFLQHSASLGAILSLLFLLIALGLLAGWTPHPVFVTTLQVLFALGALLAWFVLIVVVVSKDARRSWLAALLERGQPKLLDRMNTLVDLEKKARRDASVRAFYLRIARQAQQILAEKKPSVPLSPGRPLVHLAVCGALLILTISVYERYSPLEHLRKNRQPEAVTAKTPTPEAPDLAVPTNNIVEQKQTWGEVRITDPARDLQVTKVDVVQLQIEAAANEALQGVGWRSAVNGASEELHELPPPSDPRYAVYQPMLYLDEMQLSDWDVLTYYAKANTAQSNSFASEVYFLEVRPFREDILKMPGGENGLTYECLNEVTALINRQQHVIRQTHQHVQKPAEEANLQAQDRDKIAEAESDLSQSANHLYAKMASEMENKPIGEALNQLAKAEKHSAHASDSLRADVMPEAQNQERNALADLIAARKIFQKAISNNPDAFADQNKDEEPPPPTAEKRDKLKEIAEFRNEAKAARDFVEKAAQKQQKLAQQSASTPRANLPNLAEQEKQLRQSLEDFQTQNPKAFREVQPETERAEKSLTAAAESMQQKNSSAKTNAQEATRDLQKLTEAMKNKTDDRQLANAYKLKEMLDKEIETFGQCQKAGDSVSSAALQKSVGETRQVLRQLKNAAEEDPTRKAFGPQLREALSDPNMTSLNWPLGELEAAQDNATKEKAAGQAKEGLAKVSKAFTESEPKALQEAQKTDSLKPPPQESLGRGLAQLQSLLRELQENRQVSPNDRSKQGEEALFNLQTGLRETYGSNERGNQIMLHIEQELKKGEQPPDLENLKKLMDELQNFSLEISALESKKEDKPEVTNIDPATLPPAYRGRIEKYFQKLSEK